MSILSNHLHREPDQRGKQQHGWLLQGEGFPRSFERNTRLTVRLELGLGICRVGRAGEAHHQPSAS